MNQQHINDLVLRIGEDHLSKRLKRQVDLSAKFYAKGGYSSYHLENIKTIAIIIKAVLKSLGIYKRGLKNTMRFRIINVENTFENLPHEFHGFKILQLSDLHSDGFDDGGEKLISLIRNIPVDLCIISGDYRFLDEHVHANALQITQKIVAAINAKHGVFGVLGNHDFIEFVPTLEKFGINILLNESAEIKKNRKSIWIAGIDDAHYYDCHDIQRALAKIPKNNYVLFLSHSPETYADVAPEGVDYFISGHTHGGQLCLPGEIILFKNARCPRKYCAGAWNFNTMKGYTSRGTGSSGLPVRYNCQPEITIHTLLSAN